MRRFVAVVAGTSPALLTDEYPSTADGQSIQPGIDRPDASKLDRWPPPVKRPPPMPRYIGLAQASRNIPSCDLRGTALHDSGRGLFDPAAGVRCYPLRESVHVCLPVTGFSLPLSPIWVDADATTLQVLPRKPPTEHNVA